MPSLTMKVEAMRAIMPNKASTKSKQCDRVGNRKRRRRRKKRLQNKTKAKTATGEALFFVYDFVFVGFLLQHFRTLVWVSLNTYKYVLSRRGYIYVNIPRFTKMYVGTCIYWVCSRFLFFLILLLFKKHQRSPFLSAYV